jgi:hypothetical protein
MKRKYTDEEIRGVIIQSHNPSRIEPKAQYRRK